MSHKIDRFFSYLDEAIFSNCQACRSGRVYFMLGSGAKDAVLLALGIAFFTPWPVTTAILIAVGALLGMKLQHGLGAVKRAEVMMQRDEHRNMAAGLSRQLETAQMMLDAVPKNMEWVDSEDPTGTGEWKVQR